MNHNCTETLAYVNEIINKKHKLPLLPWLHSEIILTKTLQKTFASLQPRFETWGDIIYRHN